MKNPSTTDYDPQLSQLPRLDMVPAMFPFIGSDYVNPSHQKLLIIGESYYFPNDSTVHLDAEEWYQTTETKLNEKEIGYIHCRDLVGCDWRAAGHKMYREINSCLSSLELHYTDRAISHVSYMNCFFRPSSIPGESFRHCCQPSDIEVALDLIPQIIDILNPDIIVFASKYAWDTVGHRIKLNDSISSHFISHPTDPFHWNVASYPHGRKKFIQILQQEFMGQSNINK